MNAEFYFTEFPPDVAGCTDCQSKHGEEANNEDGGSHFNNENVS